MTVQITKWFCQLKCFLGWWYLEIFSHHFHFLPLSLDLLTEERDLEMHKSDLTSRPDGTERTGKTTVTKEARNVKFCGMSKKQIS